MDMQVHTEHLRNALERVQRATEEFGSRGSLGIVHLYGAGNAITLTMDGEVRFLALRSIGRVARAGGILLSLSDLATLIAPLPATVIRLEVDPPGRELQITSPGLVITMQGTAAPDCPTLPSAAGWCTVGRCAAQVLHDAIEQVRYATGTNDRRPVLNGARLQVHDAQASLSAADGSRLAHTAILLYEPAPQAHDLTIARNDLYALSRILNGTYEAATIQISPSGNTLMVATSCATYTCDTVEGEYPDLSRFVPGVPDAYAEVATQALREAIQIVSCLGYLADYGCITLELVPESPLAAGRVVLNATATDGDSVRAICEGPVEGQARTYRLNSIFVRDALAAIRTEHFRIEVAATDGPLYLRPVGFPEDWHLIMTMQQP